LNDAHDANDWTYEPPPDLATGIAARLKSFPRRPVMWMYALRSLCAIGMRTWLRAYHRLEITGREHLPEKGAFILVCNHTSHLDALCLLQCVPLRRLQQAFPAAAADYFFASLTRSFFSAVLINAMPFDRRLKGADSLEVCAQLLASGDNILILFPEGTRSTTGELGRFRSGIGRLVAGKPVSVVPCHLSGGLRAFPKGARFPRPERLRLRIGKPREYGSVPPAAESIHAICEELHDSVRRLGAEQR